MFAQKPTRPYRTQPGRARADNGTRERLIIFATICYKHLVSLQSSPGRGRIGGNTCPASRLVDDDDRCLLVLTLFVVVVVICCSHRFAGSSQWYKPLTDRNPFSLAQVAKVSKSVSLTLPSFLSFTLLCSQPADGGVAMVFRWWSSVCTGASLSTHWVERINWTISPG